MKIGKRLRTGAKALAALAAGLLLFGAAACSHDSDGGNKPPVTVEPPVDNNDPNESPDIPEPSFNGNLYPANDSTTAHADTDLMIKFDNTPTINKSDKTLKIRIYDGETQIDAIGSFDETYYSGNDSTGKIGEINVANELISVVGDTVLVKVHTDEQAYPLLKDAKKYTVKIDKGLISGTVGGVDPSELTWSFTTATAPSITGNSITVGGEDANFASIQGAFNYLRKNTANGDWTISVAEGSYHERLFFSTTTANVKLIGAESSEGERGDKVTVYWENNEKLGNSGARARASFLYYAKNKNLFIQHMTFINTTSRAKYNFSDVQAETLSWDASGQLIVNKCSFYSYQDTLYIGAEGGRAWLYDNYIAGDVDFIWGYGDTVLVEDCDLVARADGIKNGSYLLAPRSQPTTETNKGFVILNCTVTIEDGCSVNYGRNSGGDYSGAVINSKFVRGGSKAAFNYCMWGNKVGEKDAANTDYFDAARDAAIAFKDYGNTLDGAPISTEATEAQRGGSYLMSERVVNREYNGRYAIMNRGFDVEANVYKSAASEFDFGSYERDFGAPADVSKDNIYVEPVYVNNLLSPEKGGATTTLAVKKYNGEDVSVTWTTSDDNLATVEGGVVTAVNDASGTVNIIATTADGHKDWAVVKVIPDALTMTITVDGEKVPQGEETDYTKEKVLVLDLADTSNISSDKYKPVITGESASDAQVSYETTLDTIASVADDGTVTAKHIGNAKITVKESATATTYSYLVHVKDSSPKSSFGVTLQEVPVLSDDPEEARDFGLFAVSSAVRANTNDYKLGGNNKHGLVFSNSQSITIPVQGASTIRFAPNTNNAEADVTVTAANNTTVENTKASKNSVWLAHYTGSTATTLTFTFTGNTYIPAFSVIVDSDTTPVDVTWDFGTTGDYPVQTNVIMYQSDTGILPDPQTGAYIEINATSGKFTPRAPANADVQVNPGTVFYIPVSAQSVATINMKNASYKVNDTAATGNTTTVTASGAGFVKVEVIGSGSAYIDGSISVTGLKLAEERTGGFFSSTKAD